ncbi:MAG: S8 family serine peptidase [Halioglobus sp.]|nr:S8 family serine peptidase [Halioglobus sp.]
MNQSPLYTRIKVAIIDSGIDAQHPDIGGIKGGTSIVIGPGDKPVFGAEHGDVAGHGTACAGIVRRYAPRADLYSVRIFDDSLRADGRALVAAIEWCIDQDMDVLNLSLGGTDGGMRTELERVCLKASCRGLVLVAAAHNEGRPSYPAIFDGVIGVGAARIPGGTGHYYDRGAIECRARGDAQRVCWTQPRHLVVSGTSYAAPHISGTVAALLCEFPTSKDGSRLERVRNLLRDTALAPSRPVALSGRHPASFETAATDLRWIKKAAIYPFNKEMHALVRGRDLLPFSLAGIADPAGKGLVGKDAGEALGLDPIGVRICPRLSDACVGADTLVLGYVDQLGRIGRRIDPVGEAVRMALKRGLNVFSFLGIPPERYPDLHELARRKGLHLSYPYIGEAHLQQVLGAAGSCGPVDVPVLGVFGTSAQQGKFTLQLALRRQLLARGYRVGQLGTEHHAALFGMDLAFPMGYAPAVSIPVHHYVPYLDGVLRLLCRQRQPDLILVGGQSGIMPYDLEAHSAQMVPALAFLLGTRPDACVLVVNSIDTDTYIQDTLDGLRALAKTPTLMLAMSDKEKHIRAAYGRTFIRPRPLPGAEIERHLRRLEDRFGLPAIQITSDEGQRRMVDAVVAHFSAEEQSCQKKRA